MEGHVAAALDFEHVDALSLQQVFAMRIPAQCHDRGMLEQQEHVVGQATGDAIFG